MSDPDVEDQDQVTPARMIPARVRFGPRPTQVIPVEVASDLLTLFCQKNRKLFGDLLSQAMIEGRNGDSR